MSEARLLTARKRKLAYVDPDEALGIAIREPPPPVLVYFVQDGEGGPIKIGCAQDVRKRLRTLQSGHHGTLRLLFTLPGGMEMERRLHARFWRSRIKGEWFKPTPMLLAFVREQMNDRDPAPV